MAYNAEGMWQPEDDTVETRVTGLMSKNSGLMQQAKTAGLQQANARGLLSSSMAVGASQAEAYKPALQIASQDASQTAQKNLQAQGFKENRTIQGDSIANQQTMQGRDIEATKARQEADIKNQQQMQGTQIASTEKQQMADIAAQKERLGLQLSYDERRALADREQQTAMQQRELEAAQTQQQRDIEFQTGQKTADRTLEERIATWNVSEAQRQNASQAASSAQAAYQTELQSIMNNQNLTADQRTKFMNNAKATFDVQMGLVEQLFNIDLTWSMPSTPKTSGGTASSQAAASNRRAGTPT